MAKTGPQARWKLTPEVLQKLEQAFAIDATIREACFYADISESSYYQLVKDDPVLLEKFNRLREKPVLTARQTVVKNLDDPDMAMKYLKNKRNKEFSERTNQQHDGTINHKLAPEVIAEISQALDDL